MSLHSESSLERLNTLLAARGQPALPADRFRANVVLDGCPAHAEDDASTFRSGDVTLAFAQIDERCAVTTVDQQAGRRRGPEPLRTLATYRRLAGSRRSPSGCTPRSPSPGTLRLGDPSSCTGGRSTTGQWRAARRRPHAGPPTTQENHDQHPPHARSPQQPRRAHRRPVAAVTAPAAQAKGGDDAVRRGSCSGSTDWKVKVGPEDGRLEVEARGGQQPRRPDLALAAASTTARCSASGTRTTGGRSGSFEVRRPPSTPAGTDAFVFRAAQRAQRRALRRKRELLTRRRRILGARLARSRGSRALRAGTPWPSSWPPGLLVLVVVVIGTLQLSQHAADDEAINDARATTELLATSVAQPAIPRGLATGDPGAVDRFDRTVLRRLLVGRRAPDQDLDRRRPDRLLRRDPADRRPVPARRRRARGARATARSDAEISDLSRAGEPLRDEGRRRCSRSTPGCGRPRASRCCSRPTTPPPTSPGAASRSTTPSGRSRSAACWSLVAVTTPLLWALTRRLDRTRRDRARLLEAAADASESERRRIARDLHDGVVQDLAGTSFALSATAARPRHSTRDRAAARARWPARCAQPAVAAVAAGRDLPARPGRRRARGRARRTWWRRRPPRASTPVVEVYDVEGASDDAVRLVWRVAQEAVRNALRHARRRAPHRPGRHGRVTGCTLDVTDDGVGLRPRRPARPAALGLRSLRDLVRGGRRPARRPRSSPGDGTTVHLEVPTMTGQADPGRARRRPRRGPGRAGAAADGRRGHRGRRPGRRRRARPSRWSRETRPDVVRDGPADAGHRRGRGHPPILARGARRPGRGADVVLRQRPDRRAPWTPGRSATCSRTPTPRTSSTASGRSAAASRRSTRRSPASC